MKKIYVLLIIFLLLNCEFAISQDTRDTTIIHKKDMGTFGLNNFDNDDALDWFLFFSQEPDEKNIYLTFDKILQSKDYIEVDLSNFGIAAGELTAALGGKMSIYFPEEYKELIGKISLNDIVILRQKAIQCLKKILYNSELKELWANDKKGYNDWKLGMDDLLVRLN